MSRRSGREQGPIERLTSPRVRTAAFVAGVALVTAATCVVAYPKMFFGFAQYDDEGFLLASLQSFLSWGALYEDVYTDYGPFYYEVWGGFFSLFGIAVSHDNGRIATLAAWVLVSLMVGVSAYRITRSVLLGLSAQMLAFAVLETLTREPMHPGGLTCLLVALILLTSTVVHARPAKPAMALIGAALGALLLVKVNVGALALAAVLLVCSVSYPLPAARWIRPLIAAGFVLTPLVLMADRLDTGWARGYCLHVTVAALPVALLLTSRASRATRDPAELRWLAAGLLAAAFAICLVVLARGTSPGGLLEGVIGRPLGQSSRFAVPYQPSIAVAAADLAALGGLAAYWHLARSGRLGDPPWQALVSLGSVAVGLGIAIAVIGPLAVDDSASDVGGYVMGLLAFTWVALARLPGGDAPRAATLALCLLPPLAVLQALHAYPVGGSQIGWSTFLLIPVGAICIANGVRGLAYAADRLPPDRRRRASAVAPVAAVALFLLVADTTLRRGLDEGRAEFDAGVSLNLPGSEKIRLTPGEAGRYRAITHALLGECATFLSLPALNSFHFWTGRGPPTGLNGGEWMSDEEQARLLAYVGSLPDLCLLEQPIITEFWFGSRLGTDGPLAVFAAEGFDRIDRFGPYSLSRRASREEPK